MYKHINLDTEILKDDDYGTEGIFFVTINTASASTEFCEISKGKSRLTKSGRIVEKSFLEMEQHFLNLKVQEYIIMPNHLHAIVQLSNVPPESLIIQGVSRFEMSFGLMVGRLNPFMLKGSIFHAITWFKSSSLIELRKNGFEDFTWKSGYYDFTILNETSYNNIKSYILNDPKNWPYDIDHPDNNFRSIIY